MAISSVTKQVGAAGPVGLLAVLMALLPAAGVPHELMLQDSFKSALLAGGTLLAVLLFLRQAAPSALRWHSLLLVPLALAVYALGSVFWSHGFLAAVEAVRWSVLGLLLWLLLQCGTPAGARQLAWGVHLGLVVASLWAALQFWFGWSLFPQAAAPASSFINRNFFAEYAVCALPYSLWLLASEPRALRAPWLAASVAWALLAIWMTGTRSALLALLVLLPVALMFAWRLRRQLAWPQWRRNTRLAVAAALLGVCLAGGHVPGEVDGVRMGALERSGLRLQPAALQQDAASGSISVRTALWKSSLRMALDQPWRGVGAGAWEAQVPRYQGAVNATETDYYAHNEVLQLLCEYGLPLGGLVLAFLLGYGLLAARTTWVQADAAEGPLRAAALCSLLALAVVSLTGFPWHLAGTAALGVVGLGLLANSDLRLGLDRAVYAGHWRTHHWQLRAAALLVACGLLACAVVAIQTARAEAHFIRAIYAGTALQRVTPQDTAARDRYRSELVTHLQAGLALHPHARQLASVSADALAQAGFEQDAVHAWEAIAASRPHIANVWANLALVYLRLQQPHDAARALAHLQPLQPLARRTQVIEVLVWARTGEAARALVHLERYVAEPRPDTGLLEAAYLVARDTGDTALGLRAVQRQLELGMGLTDELYFRLGLLHADRAASDEALGAFKAGLAAATAEDKARFRAAVPPPYNALLN